MKAKVAVVGLGYVGLPLALLAAKKYPVLGFDTSEGKINSLKSGKSYIDDITDSQVAESSMGYTTDIASLGACSTFIICVPTPVSDDKMPDLTPLKGAVRSVCTVLKEGDLVIIESTINPGVCDEVIIPLIEENTSLKVGNDLDIAHCPERINPGDKRWNVSNINRVVGSNTERGLSRAYDFYSEIIDADIKKMGSLKEAEAVKIVENSFRDINIAFVNELAMSFSKLNINLENVIEGAATKPFSFMPHHPSIGVGGHCIPVDPYYLIEYASSHGFEHRFLSLARTINEEMPDFTLSLLQEAKRSLSLPDMNVTVLGLSYKADVADLRESPAIKFVEILRLNGYTVDTYDPYLEDDSSVKTLHEALSKNGLVVLATNHTPFVKEISPTLLKRCGVKVFIDGKNVFYRSISEFEKAGIYYTGIGV